MFTIKHHNGHVVVLKDGVFFCSADTLGEAYREIEEYEHEN